MDRPASFGIIGGSGFRAQYYLRIAAALPERFRASGLVVQNPERGEEMERQWQIPVYRTSREMVRAERPDFVLVSVSRDACPAYLLEAAEQGIPALAETPPAPDLNGLIRLHRSLTTQGARIQVAEQYPWHPLMQARRALIDAGRLGRVTEATVSISHLYHAAALMRAMLGIGFEDASIRAMRFESQWVEGPSRAGPPPSERLIPLQRDLAWLDFGGKLGIYDFTQNQHRSWTRSNHLSVRGERGEIFDASVKLLERFDSPLYLELRRVNRGEAENAEGYFLQGIQAGESWLYRNPFAPARLYDDELAIAACLDKMAAYAAGGPGFYGLPEASQDHYLGLLIEEAIRTGATVRSERQPWTDS